MKGVILHATASSVIFENEDGLHRFVANLRAYDLRIGDSIWFHAVSKGLEPLTDKEIDSTWRARETLKWTEEQYAVPSTLLLHDDILKRPDKHVEVNAPATLICETYELSPDTTPIFKVNRYLSTVGECYDPDPKRCEKAGTVGFYRTGFVTELMRRFGDIDTVYERISEFSVKHREYDHSFLSSNAFERYIDRPIYVQEERAFFKNWHREVVERGVRLYNLEPKEIYHTGYPINEITNILWRKPHMLLGINEGVLRRLQNTLKINTSPDDLLDRKLLLWVDTECVTRQKLGVTLAEIKREHGRHISNVMGLLGDDLEIVMIPKVAGHARKDRETPLIMTKNRYLASTYISSFINDLNKSSEMYTRGSIVIKDRKLDPDQREAVRLALTQNFHIITGPAGSGKTTIIRAITKNLDLWQKKWILLAFTGIATYNMRRKADTENASTIDLLLAQLTRNKGVLKNFRDLRHIIIDEASMINSVTMKRLFQAIKEYGVRAKITFIGDPNQLPPVGAGTLFETLIDYRLASMSMLKTVHRTKNEPDNALYINSTRIANGERKLIEGDEFIISKGVEMDVFNKVRAMLAGGYSPSDIKVLCPYKNIKEWKYGSCTEKHIIDMLNTGLQNIMNPTGHQIPSTAFRVGDQVMVTINDHKRGVFNGSQGVIVGYDDANLKVEFEGEVLLYSLKKIWTKRDNNGESEERKASQSVTDLVLSYALTIHKAQGMEWPLVIIFLPHFCKPDPEFMTRRLLYTAVTRAKDIVVIVCRDKATVEAISAMEPSPQWDPSAALINSRILE